MKNERLAPRMKHGGSLGPPGQRAMLPQSRGWPAVFPAEESSLCSGERWAYALAPDGAASLRFTGRVDVPPGFVGTNVPLEYRGAK